MTDTTPTEQHTILIIDDHAMIAEALNAAFARTSDLRPVGTATSIVDGVRMIGQTQPDVVLSDLRLREGNVVDHIPALRQACSSAKILIMTGWSDEESFLRAIGAGVEGFLDKLQPLDELTEAIRRSLRGELVMAPSFLPAMTRRNSPPTDGGQLSEPELQVLQRLSGGMTTREIANALHVSVDTVRNHVSQILVKLGAHSRLEAVYNGVRRGVIRLTPD
jgi:DNA-binding NarL/FixJ family response regulator